jgi:hypothetical protein
MQGHARRGGGARQQGHGRRGEGRAGVSCDKNLDDDDTTVLVFPDVCRVASVTVCFITFSSGN